MGIFAALVWREIAERRLLLLASLMLGLVPIVLPWLPGIPSRFTPEEIRTATTIGLAALFGVASLLMLGSTIVGRDLSERRLGFFFSRPVSSWTLWLSRIVAAWALVVIAVLLIVTPTAIVDSGAWLEPIWQQESAQSWPILGLGERRVLLHFNDERLVHARTPERFSPPMQVVVVCLVLLLVLVFTHAVATMVRGRNAWVLADLGGMAVVLGLFWNAREVLVREQALGALVWAERFLVPAILVALVVAGGVQLAFGRTDLQRGHRYLSMALWPSLFAVALFFSGYSRWVASSTISDLEQLTRVAAAPGERWLMVGGPVRHRAGARAAFLLEVDSGRSWRLGSLSVARAWLTFSPDGETAVWVRCPGVTPPACELWAKDLRDVASPPWRTGISINLLKMRWTPGYENGGLTFNDDGTLLAITEAKRLVVYALGSESQARLLAAVDAKLPEAVAFLPENQVRFHQQPSRSRNSYGERGDWTQIQKLDLATRGLVETGRLPAGYGEVRSPTRDLLFYQRRFFQGLGLHDGETGQAFAKVEDHWAPMFGWGHFLADGRLIVGHFELGTHQPGHIEPGRLSLLVLSPEGREHHQLERAAVIRRRLGGELSPGRLLIGLQEEPPPTGQVALHEIDVEPMTGWNTYVLDADSGELSLFMAGVLPVGRSGVSTERLFRAASGEIVRFNAKTGESRTILSVE